MVEMKKEEPIKDEVKQEPLDMDLVVVEQQPVDLDLDIVDNQHFQCEVKTEFIKNEVKEEPLDMDLDILDLIMNQGNNVRPLTRTVDPFIGSAIFKMEEID